MKNFAVIFIIFLVLSSCMSQSSGTRTSKAKLDNDAQKKRTPPVDNTGDTDTELYPEISPDSTVLEPEILLNGIIDPLDGVHKTKITLPKNYNGLLYLTGLNLSYLKNRIPYVRFRFGLELEDVTLQGVIAKGSGIVPDTQTDQLIVDLKSVNFNQLRIHYDLYDYKDYNNSEDKQLISDPRDKNLYCRGLHNDNDPTFQKTVERQSCNYQNARCLYSYASLIDNGIYDSANLTTIRKYPLYNISGGGYDNDPLDIVKGRCLPDSKDILDVITVLGPLARIVSSNSNESIIRLSGDKDYIWRGPYRASSFNLWKISGLAIFGKYGLFQKNMNISVDPAYGYESNLFPRASKMNLRAGQQYMGGEEPFGKKAKQNMLSSGESLYMDGCSMRVVKPQIGKCNVVSDIEVFYYNEKNEEVSVTKNKNLKIQLIEENNIFTNPKTCQTDNHCGSDECCFNNQCFEKNLVGGKCQSDSQNSGGKNTGETCRYDTDCLSLCCNGLSICSPHVYNQDEKVLCSKDAGQSCISKEFCKEYFITTCYKVKTGYIDNRQTCSIRCYYKPTFGDCVNNRCQTPKTPSVPTLDLKNPDCSDAIDPPTEF